MVKKNKVRAGRFNALVQCSVIQPLSGFWSSAQKLSCVHLRKVSRSSSSEVRIRVPFVFSVVYFSRGTLPTKKGKRALLGSIFDWLAIFRGSPFPHVCFDFERTQKTHPWRVPSRK